MASRKKRFFYFILTNHFFLYEGEYLQQLGYGVTDGPAVRIRKYSGSSGGEQEFCRLWYSPTYKAEVLEDLIKERISSESHRIFGESVEWIKPDSKLTISDLEGMVTDIIKEFKLDIRAIKADYLPFNDSEWQKEINQEDIDYNPDKYLEPK